MRMPVRMRQSVRPSREFVNMSYFVVPNLLCEGGNSSTLCLTLSPLTCPPKGRRALRQIARECSRFVIPNLPSRSRECVNVVPNFVIPNLPDIDTFPAPGGQVRDDK